MNSPRFDRFAQPQFLQWVGRERLTQILLPFAPELLAHGISLPATALPDEIFFIVLTALARRPEGLSAPLLDAMMAIEVMEQVFPDEVPAAPCPLVVTELRLRLGAQQRPILLQPAGDCQGLLDGVQAGIFSIEHSALNIEGETVAATEPQPSEEDGGSRMESGVTEVETARGQRDLVSPRQPSPGLQQPSPGAPRHPLPSDGRGASPAPASEESARTKAAARFKFRQKGSVCVVKFDGGPKFHLANTDGAKYLDHLLHRPNEVIRAFDLERAVKPDKAAAREANSIQRAADARTLREARAELVELETELAEAEAEGLAEKVERLELEIAQIKKLAVKSSLLTSDTGERARNNVRKAIGKVIAKLRKGGAAEQAFALHLTQSISLGYDVVYTSPAGKVWR